MARNRRDRSTEEDAPAFEEPSEATEAKDAEEPAPFAEVVPPATALPVGLKEMDHMEVALFERWEKRVEDDGTHQWISRGDFKVPGGAVPQGTIRSLPEAYALEMQRCG